MKTSLGFGRICIFGLGLLLILAISSASAQTLIGVHFISQNSGGGIVTGTAGVMPQQDWNNPTAFARTPGTGGQTSVALNDSNGNPTPVTLTANMADSWVSGAGTNTQDLTLMNGILKVVPANTNDTADLTYKNVPAGSYNIFVYCAEDATGSYGNLSIASANQTYYLTEPNGGSLPGLSPALPAGYSKATQTTDLGASNPLANYVEFTGVQPVGGQITIAVQLEGGGNTGFGVAGTQLFEIPPIITWTGGGGSSGNGSWDTSSSTANWATTTGAVPSAYSDAAQVTFDDGGANTNIAIQSGGVLPFSVIFNNSVAKSYAFSGGAIGGTTGVTISGGGNVTFNATNTYSGATTITNGSLRVGNSNAVQNSTVTVNAANGLMFAAGLGTANLGGLAGSANIAMTDVGNNLVNLSVGSNGASTAYSGNLSGGGSFTKTGSGTLILSGTNSYLGTTFVSGGSLNVAGAIPTTPVVLSNGGNLTLAPQQLNLTGQASLATASTTQGGFPASNAFDASLTTRWAANVNNNQWVELPMGASYSLSQIKIAWEAAYAKDYDIVVANNPTGNPNISGTGGWTIVGTVTNNTVGQGGSIGAYVTTNLTPVAATNLAIYSIDENTGNNFSIWDVQEFTSPTSTISSLNSSDPTTSVTLALPSTVLATGSDNTDALFAGTITGAGGVTKVGTGKFTLTNATNNYTGPTTVSNGKLVLASGSGLGATAITVGGSGTLRANPNTGTTVSVASGGSLALAESSTFDMSGDNNAGTFSVGGTVRVGDSNGGANLLFDAGLTSGGASVTDKLAATGAVTVSGANTITIVPFGSTGTFTPGTFSLISSPAGLTLNGGASFALFNNSVTINGTLFNLALQSTTTTENLVVTLPAINGQWSQTGSSSPYNWGDAGNWSTAVPGSQAGDTATFGAATANSQTINLVSGKTVGGITFNNTGGGNYTIGGDGPTLTIDNQGAGAVINNNNGNNTIAATVSLNDTLAASAAAGTTLTFGAMISSTSAKAVQINNAVGATGIVALTQSNTFSGGLTIANGTVQVPNVNNASANGPLGMQTSVLLGSISGTTGTIELVGGQPVSSTMPFALVGGGSGSFIVDSNTLTLSGNITTGGSGTASLITGGGGVLVLSGGGNSFAGGLNINGGTVRVGNAAAGTIGSGQVTFGSSNTPTLDLFGNSPTVTGLVGTGANGVITNSAASALSTLTLNGAGTSTYGGSINNGANANVAVTLTGGGTQTLTGTNTFTGGIQVANGTMVIGPGGSIGSANALAVGDGTHAGIFQLGNSNGAGSATVASIANNGQGSAIVGGASGTSRITLLTPSTVAVPMGVFGGSGTNQNNLNATFSGAGAVTITGSTTINGGVTSTGGGSLTIPSTSIGATPVGSGTLTLAGTTLNLQGAQVLNTIGVHFGTNQGAQYVLAPTTSAGVGGFAMANWNNTGPATGSASSLVNNSGVTTGAAVSWNSPGGIQSAGLQTSPTGDNQMMGSFLNTNVNTLTVNFSNIPYASYEVVTYVGAEGQNGRTGNFSVGGTPAFYYQTDNTPQSVPYQYIQITNTNSSLDPGGNYAITPGQTSSSLAISYTNTNSFGGVMGVEIVNTAAGPASSQTVNPLAVTATSTINITNTLALTTPSLSINNSTLSLTSADTSGSPYSLTATNAATLTGNAIFNVANSSGGGTGTLALNNVSGSGFSINKMGAGALSLGGVGTYTGGTTVSAGLVISNATGSLGSGPVTLAAGTLRAGTVSLGAAGFGGTSTNISGGGTGWTVNNNGIASNPINNNVLTLTTNTNNQARSAIFNTPQSLAAAFTASFTYRDVGGGGADGATFLLLPSTASLNSLGNIAGNLGYQGIAAPAVAYEINVYSGNPPLPGTNFITNGTVGTYRSTGAVNLASGDAIGVTLKYDPVGQTLTETLTDQTNPTTPYTNTYTGVNLSSTLGTSSALIGFTGSTGGANTTQTISNFAFTRGADGLYSNSLILPGGANSNIDVAATAQGPTATFNGLSVGSGGAATLNVTATTAPSNTAYGLNVGGVTLNSDLTINVANNPQGGTGTVTLGALADGGTARNLNLAGPGVVVLATPTTAIGGTSNVNLSGGTLRIGNGTTGSVTGTATLNLNGGLLAALSTAGGSLGGPVVAGSGAHTIAPSNGFTAGTYATLNFNGGLTTNTHTTLNFNLGTIASGMGSNNMSIYSGDLLKVTGLTVGSGTNITFGTNPTSSTPGDYRLIGGTFGTPPLGNFVLPAAPSNTTYALSTGVDNGFIDLVVTAGSTSLLTLPGTGLTGLNVHVGASGTPFSTTVTNGDPNSAGNYVPSSGSGDQLAFNPSGGASVPASGSATLNFNWASTGTAGSRNGNIVVTNSSNANDTATPKSQAVSGGVYNLASTGFSGATLNFGNYHVGATPPTAQTVSISNSAPATGGAGGFTEGLDASFGSPTNPGIQTSGSISDLYPEGGANSSLSVTISTSVAGSQAGTVAIGFNSDGSGTSGLASTGLGSQTVTITGGNVYSGQAQWAPTSGANWSLQSNWLDTVSGVHVGAPGIAGFNGDTATFTGTAAAVTLDVSPTLAAMTFNTAVNTGYTIAPTGSNRITLSTGGAGAASVTLTSGSHTISAPVTVAAGGVNISGAGALTLSGSANTFNGNITVGTGSDSPTLVINAGGTVNSNVGPGVIATVASGATLELAGLKSALVDQTNPTVVANRASVQNAGTLQIGDLSNVSTQQVGDIDPDGGMAGSVVVSAGSSLTADHIIQTSLVIGNNAVFTLAPSDPSGSPMVGLGSGSGLALASSLTPSSSFVATSGSLLGAGSVSSASSVSLAGGGVSGASLNAVPEPSSMLLLGLGGLALSAIAMRKRCAK